ncbi:MAG: ABC transporter permease [Proteobacteria bacterium]|nr:ABC transporter permease [Pseudomonadota bacterium]MCL2307515.1 ABC transporter permease [Pseudomonadota bacterium]
MSSLFSWRRAATVLRKECLDAFRDRRTLLMLLLPPLLVGPLFLMLIFNLIATQSERAQTLTLAVQGSAHAPALIAFLERQQVTLKPLSDDYENQIRRGHIDIALIIPEDFPDDVAAGRAASVQLVYDRSRDRSQVIIAQVEHLLAAHGREWGRMRLLLRGIAPEVAAPLKIQATNLATPQQSGALLLSLVAFYALFATLTGGMAVALDAGAGERERQSLQPLLITPAQPFELVTGKWAAAAIVNTLVVALTLAGFYLTLRFAPLPAVGMPFLFGLAEVGRFSIALLPIALLLPALHFFVGIRGRSVREAQASTSVLLLLFALLPIAQMLLQQREPDWIAAVPVAGHYTLLTHALRGDALSNTDIVWAYLVPLALLLLVLIAAAQRLNREARL